MELKASDTFVIRRKCSYCGGEGWLVAKDPNALPHDPSATREHSDLWHQEREQRGRFCAACSGRGYTEHTIAISDLLMYIITVLDQAAKKVRGQ